jgi:hypothetical protein
MKENSKSEIRNPKQMTKCSKFKTDRPGGDSVSVIWISPVSNLLTFPPRRGRISDFVLRASLWMVIILVVAGCAARPERLRVCPGKATVEESLQMLAANAATAVPLRSRGEAMLTYHVPDKRTPERHNLILQVRFEPPSDIYVLGGVSVNQRAVIMGSNREQFWLAISVEEISDYYLGDWDEARGGEGRAMGMSPQVVLEAFGILAEPNDGLDPGSWTLSNKGPYDILTRRDETGRLLKRVYVYACDYRVYKIEYFDRRGRIIAVAQLGAYEPVDGFYVPTQIRIVSTAPDGRKDTMEIKLSGLRTTEFSDRQRQVFFNPPEGDDYENVYQYEAGQWVPQ